MTGSAASSASRHPRVVIVGGGIAGMSAAMALAGQRSAEDDRPSWEIVLVEAKSAAGGRAGSFTDPASHETIDYCQHVAMGCCTNLLSLLREAGLSECFTRYDELHFYHPSTGASLFRANGWLPAPLHLHSALSGLKYLSRRQQRRIRGGLWRLMRTTHAAVSDFDAATWLSRHGQDAELRARFWDPILVSALGDVPECVSMAAARKVIVDGFAAARGASDVWVPNRTLSEVFGTTLIQVLKERGVRVRTGNSVREIRRGFAEGDTGEASVVLGDGETIAADHVILATNWRAASRLVDTLRRQSWPLAIARWHRGLMETLASIEPSPISGLHLWFDRPLTPHPHVVMVGTTAQWLFRDPVRQGTDPAAGHYHQVVISGRHPFSDAAKNALVERVTGELRAAFPAAKDAVLLHSRTVTDPASVFRISPDLESRRPSAATPLSWLHLAGDYVRTGWPATMEGAVISGRQAAESILRQSSPSSSCSPLVLPGLPPGRLARRLIRECGSTPPR
ncbi:hydroxysqualene dehydroxylase HpnE [Allorhodopirellula solitaria]|uniref:15-cis-phytoene desaturase n=1 Tax=Allorhodopirellula solitaria TaxID=2527987 RepID=A0A5C5XP72_9BACT|nr:hydroxysqualene dehydroxylase HpnE [Allorhodopirellula solitaria]TWT64704.1 15-cis-phytoene desaturase [Allorhodopirellula solitaria]